MEKTERTVRAVPQKVAPQQAPRQARPPVRGLLGGGEGRPAMARQNLGLGAMSGMPMNTMNRGLLGNTPPSMPMSSLQMKDNLMDAASLLIPGSGVYYALGGTRPSMMNKAPAPVSTSVPKPVVSALPASQVGAMRGVGGAREGLGVGFGRSPSGGSFGGMTSNGGFGSLGSGTFGMSLGGGFGGSAGIGSGFGQLGSGTFGIGGGNLLTMRHTF